MKNQYFGDINDYIKYSILRRIMSTADLRLMVCWMLTQDDGGTDGGLRTYLGRPHEYRQFDPVLFDGLQSLVGDHGSVSRLAQADLLPGAGFYARNLSDREHERDRYFTGLWRSAANYPFLFFDPDNGMEVGSVRRGRRNSSKYLYWTELLEALRRRHSIVVYQHFPRVPRERYLRELLNRLRGSVEHSIDTLAIYSSRVAYLVGIQPEHRCPLDEVLGELETHSFPRLAVIQPT